MKIAVNLRVLHPGKIGGMEVYVRNLLAAMLRQDDSLRLLLFLTEENEPTFDFPAERVDRHLVRHDDYAATIRAALKSTKPDLFFCPLLTLEPLVVPFPTAVTIPDVQHEYYPDFFPPEVLSWRRKYFLPTALRADAVLTLSEFSKAGIVHFLSISPDKVHAIPLAAGQLGEDSCREEPGEEIVRRYGLPSDFLFYPANTWPHKNHRNLLRALSVFRDRHGAVPHLVLTGDQSSGSLEQAIAELNLSGSVTHLGFIPQPDVLALYRNARCLIFPSQFEGFGLPVLEAMALGCPVICSATTSLPDLAREAALYVDPSDPEDIATKLRDLLCNSQLREKLIKQGRRRANDFSWEATAGQTLEIFRDLVQMGPHAEDLPAVSVVTPSYNQGQFIRDTVESVLNQDYPRIEYIVADGGSTDTTLEVLRSYGERIRWVSERDKGQADAVNKGFQMAHGEILGWLNSDDTYEPGAISEAVEQFLLDPQVAMVYGQANYLDRTGAFIGRYPSEPFRWERLGEFCFLCQPSVFLRAWAVKQVGPLDIELRTCMDLDYWLRLGQRYAPSQIVFLPYTTLANSRLYQETKTLGQRDTVYHEVARTVAKYFGKVAPSWTHGYVQEVVLKTRLKRFESLPKPIFVFAGCFLIWKFLVDATGLRRAPSAARDAWKWTRRLRPPEPSERQVYTDGWVGPTAKVELHLPARCRTLLIRGQHVWPMDEPLSLEILVDQRRVGSLEVREKGRFSRSIPLPRSLSAGQSVLLTLRANKTFVPYSCGINEDRRELSFILERLEGQ